MRDIIITVPKKISWEEYEKELNQVKDWKYIMSFKVSNFPDTGKGKKCYIVHDGFIKGWMIITGMKEKKFTCQTTGKEWAGKFIERSGPFNYLKTPIEMKGFQGFRYVK